MITLYFEINNIENILQLYDRIQVIRYVGGGSSFTTPVGEISTIENWEQVLGIAPYTAPVPLLPATKAYYIYDDMGSSTDWYSSRYVSSTDSSVSSGWSTPVLGDGTALYVNPMYPNELSLNSSENRVVDRIRLLIGDPYNLNRDVGEEVLSNFHPGGTVYKLGEKGWPISINMAGQQYTSLSNPTVNGYKYLKFNSDVSNVVTTSGISHGVDVWYYTFRYSDKEILDAYDNTPVPDGLTLDNATTESYILNSAIDLVRAELWLDSTESGAIIDEDRSVYNPTASLETRRKLLDSLEKKLDKIVKALKMINVKGVLID